MADDWIKMRVALHNDPAVIGICAELKTTTDDVVGKLHRLWSWADTHSTNGTIKDIDRAWVDAFICAGFSRAMEKFRWIKFTKHGVTFPKFKTHNGASGKKRAQNAIRQARARSKKKNESRGIVTQESRTERDESVTRGEENREEKSRVKNTPKPPEELTGGILENTAPKSTSSLPVGFLRFWSAWPKHQRKSSKNQCARIWTRQSCEAIADHVVSMVETLKKSPDWTKEGGRYIPAPRVWLNQGRWDTEPENLVTANDLSEVGDIAWDNVSEEARRQILGGDEE